MKKVFRAEVAIDAAEAEWLKEKELFETFDASSFKMGFLRGARWKHEEITGQRKEKPAAKDHEKIKMKFELPKSAAEYVPDCENFTVPKGQSGTYIVEGTKSNGEKFKLEYQLVEGQTVEFKKITGVWKL